MGEQSGSKLGARDFILIGLFTSLAHFYFQVFGPYAIIIEDISVIYKWLWKGLKQKIAPAINFHSKIFVIVNIGVPKITKK